MTWLCRPAARNVWNRGTSTGVQSPVMPGRPHGRHGQFVGRDHELAVIDDARGAARAGRGACIIVSGDAGIGKSALCERAAEHADADGFTVAWGRCWSGGGAPALWPWPEVLTDLGGSDAAQLLAEDAGRSDLDPERFARFNAVGELLADVARTAPLLVVLDDAHEADVAAMLLARFLARSIDLIPVVLLMATRPRGGATRDRQRSLAELERHATILPLRPFDVRDTAALLAARGVKVEDYGLVPALTRLTDGSPLLLSRAVGHGSSSNDLAGARHVIGDTFGRLAPEQCRIVAHAAVLGMDATASEIATLCDDALADVQAALDAASRAGLMDPGPAGWAFTHDLVRHSALGLLTGAETMEAHARAVTLAADDDRSGVAARRAHHGLAAAARSDADAAVAVDLCRDAARVLTKGFDYEGAEAMLASAAALAERLTPPAGRLEVLLEWGDALLLCGCLADARPVFERAVAAAADVSDPIARARAALGLGGVWLYEHRGEVERRRVLGMQASALEALPPTATSLRARLRVRLAGEAVYDGGDTAPVLGALDAARTADDPKALAEALSLCHHALLAPEHLDARL